MKPNEIYGELMIREISPRQIAARRGVAVSTVHRAIRGERATGFACRFIRADIAQILGRETSEVWPPDPTTAEVDQPQAAES